MRTRKKELDKIVKLLEQEHEDVHELAEQVWKLVDELRREREVFVVGVNYQGVGQFLYGMYESKAVAEKDCSGKGNLKALADGDTYRIFNVLKPEIQSELFDSR